MSELHPLVVVLDDHAVMRISNLRMLQVRADLVQYDVTKFGMVQDMLTTMSTPPIAMFIIDYKVAGFAGLAVAQMLKQRFPAM